MQLVCVTNMNHSYHSLLPWSETMETTNHPVLLEQQSDSVFTASVIYEYTVYTVSGLHT